MPDDWLPLEAVLGNIDEGVVLSTADGRVVYVNPPAARLLAIDEGTLMGWRFGERYDGYAPSRVLERLAETADATEELRLPEHDRTLIVRIRSVRDAEGETAFRMAVLRDISEYVRTERLRREFVANASHELRTPVAAAAAALEAAEMALDDPTARAEFVARARDEIEALRQLAQSLLDLSTAEEAEAKSEVALPHGDAGEVARDIVESMRPLAAQRAQTLEVEVESGALVVMPALELARVLRNLIDNAIKYSPEASRIAVAVHAQETVARVDVIDSGEGIPSAQLQRVFERFFRLDRSRSGSSGAGLGLAIARHLVERRGGRLEVANEPSGGARFTLVLPRSTL